MNEKLIINTSLLRKESCFEPKPCLVEKVLEMPAAAFARLISPFFQSITAANIIPTPAICRKASCKAVYGVRTCSTS